ncbi:MULTISPECIES: thioredoxin family protein [Haloarcula]|uniref:Thiol reductase thioredoxin n=1 Tax=Haloarcula pellucida TaxID=1427151 RepID=A0A830GJ22_9EURY|nr:MULTISPECIES: thioredoxin family protein [Halomicroarcula]MBX0347632.1 thioredoxin family protein [Halomicroarcula pellucida]MDS0276434.1 thioredoxin family protein [Halomicroarcula sp. S1AR25-4]GGN89656.1 thiol reductase thioredoxin [Halomicroarcula pellucida]
MADASETESTDTPIHVESEAHLDELVADTSVLLVDFYADWCGPCRLLEPAIETVAADTSAGVAKIDVDEAPALAREFGVRGVPTLLLLADGDPVERRVGLEDETTLRTLIDEHRR